MGVLTKVGGVVAAGVAAYGAFTVIRHLREINAARDQVRQSADAAAAKVTEMAEAAAAKTAALANQFVARATEAADQALTRAGARIDEYRAAQADRNGGDVA